METDRPWRCKLGFHPWEFHYFTRNDKRRCRRCGLVQQYWHIPYLHWESLNR